MLQVIKMKKIVKFIIPVLIVALIATTVIVPVVLKSKGRFAKGNDIKYSVEYTDINENSPIAGKRIIFLGSSVTYGSASEGESFVDYLEKRDGIIPVKEAVSGTTLVDDGNDEDSYVQRLYKLDRDMKVDAFVCQLSTNDAKKKKPLGEVAEGFDSENFKVNTVAGAIEYIISYAKGVWNCPVFFFTETKYDSERYGKMVELLNQIAQKWEINVINLWDDDILNGITPAERELYMADDIHPTRAGYKLWWLPRFETYLFAKLDNKGIEK